MIADMEGILKGDAGFLDCSALFRQWTAFFGSSAYEYDIRLALADGSTVAASIFFASGITIAVSSPPERASNWDSVIASAAILAAVSLIQVASVIPLPLLAMPLSSRVAWVAEMPAARLKMVVNPTQVQCGFARAILYQLAKSFLQGISPQDNREFAATRAKENAPFRFKFFFGLLNICTQFSFYWMFRLCLITLFLVMFNIYRSASWYILACIPMYEILAIVSVFCISSGNRVLENGFEDPAMV